MITFNFESVVSSNREPYNNVAAHEELKSMMSRFDRLNIFFDIDEDGYEVIKVESTYVKRFAYQLNDESANWLMLQIFHFFPAQIYRLHNSVRKSNNKTNRQISD